MNQLLDLSKLDSGKLNVNNSEGNPVKLLRAIASSFSSMAAERNIDFIIDMEPRNTWASFDRVKLEQIVYNLLSNAFKFTPNNGKIAFAVSHAEDILHIKVLDSGMGIPEDQVPYIFERFYQADNKKDQEIQGTGIGLAVTKELVELMGGTIEVESKLDYGSCFKIALPIQEIQGGHLEMDLIENQNMNLEVGIGQIPKKVISNKTAPTILIIEDNPDMRDLIRQDLSKTYTILEATNGNDGLAMALQKSPDLIITDVMMPKMGGMELCQKLKTHIITSHIPIIMLTAKVGFKSKLKGLEIGADDYLTKPFNARELKARVKNLIESRERLRKLFKSTTKIDPKKVTVTSMDEKFVAKLKELLENNYDDTSFNVPEMQKALAMGKTQLHRKIKSITGQSPGELLRNFRLRRAAQLIKEGDDDISQIAYSVGFNSLSYFSKRFKESFGIPPSEFREE
ncbi:MAG: response regulator [Maribacter sp.]|nr:response regulator [Maribacter sp.]